MPVIEIPDRICPHCGGTRWNVENEKRGNRIKVRYRCNTRAVERSKRFNLKNPDRHLQYNERTAKKRAESGYYKTEKYKQYSKQRSKRQSETLCNNFILNEIVKSSNYTIPRSQIPKKLIDLKRKQLLLHRQLKQLENGTK